MSQLDLNSIVANGFEFNKEFNNDTDVGLAFVSLKTALKAYFSTYQACKLNLLGEQSYNNSYCEACIETIIHFQHFSELVCKKILKDCLINNNQNLLSLYEKKKNGNVRTLDKDDNIATQITDKIKNKINLSFEEQENIRVKDAKSIIDELKSLNNLNFDFLKYEDTCMKLNYLRNSILHKGIFILHYKALDIFIGSYVLPFVKDALNLSNFSSNTHIWKYKELFRPIDPIDEIIEESKLDSPDTGKLAFLKELGRAAYENPLSEPYEIENSNHPKIFPIFNQLNVGISKFFDKQKAERAKKIAINLNKKNYLIKNCPVCGVESLVIYYDKQVDGKTYAEMVKCECCTFELYNETVKNACDYGFYGIDDYWKEIE